MSNKSKAQKRNKLLMKLQDEIIDIEKQIKMAKYQNIKIAGVKSLKIFKHISIAALPIVLSASLVVGVGYALGGGFPLVLDDVKRTENIMKEFDSRDSYRIERHYENLSQNNQLIVCSNWSLNEQGMYQRQVDKYSFNKYNEEDIINVVNSGDLSTIFEIIGNPYSFTEEKKQLTEEEQKDNSNYIQATLYSVNDDNFRIIKESSSDNGSVTFGELLIFAILVGVATPIAWSEYEPYYRIREEISKKYSKTDVATLRKQLSIRQDNLSRIR